MTQTASYGGTTYQVNGPDSAPVVALIHGLGLNRHTWQWHESDLSNHFRVLSYDLFGHGDSVPPPEKPSLGLFSRQLRDLLDHLSIEQCAIIGFSLGGMINRRFAIDHPDRVTALGILNSPHERSPEAQKIVESRAAQTSAQGPAANLDETIERWFTAHFRKTHPDIIMMIRQWVLSNDPTHYAQCRQVLASGVMEIIRPDPPIAIPSLVITAENDSGSTPSMSLAIADEIPDSRIIILPGLQHMALVESPHLFTEPILEFLETILNQA